MCKSINRELQASSNVLFNIIPKPSEFTIPVELLKIEGVKINRIDIDENQSIIIQLESLETDTKCHVCGKYTHKTDGKEKPRLLRHLPMFSHQTYISITPKRYRCNCGAITVQTFSWHTPKAHCTSIYEDHLLKQVINSTLSDVSIKEDINYETLRSIMRRKIDTSIDWKTIKENITVIGIDEIALLKGHKDYVTIVTGYSEGKLLILGVLKGKEKDTVKQFLKSIPFKIRQKVESVCVDLYTGFINAAKEVFPKKIKIVADRFHVAKLYRKSLDNLRKKELKRLKKELSKTKYEKIKGVMWILRKKPSTLLDEENKTLEILFSHSPALKKAYNFSNQLTEILNTDFSKFQGKHKFNSWISAVKKSRLSCFNTFIKTLTKFKDEIANYFIHRYNSGFVEGLNNKIKCIKRRCYGITRIKHLFQRIYLDISGYSRFSG